MHIFVDKAMATKSCACTDLFSKAGTNLRGIQINIVGAKQFCSTLTSTKSGHYTMP